MSVEQVGTEGWYMLVRPPGNLPLGLCLPIRSKSSWACLGSSYVVLSDQRFTRQDLITAPCVREKTHNGRSHDRKSHSIKHVACSSLGTAGMGVRTRVLAG